MVEDTPRIYLRAQEPKDVITASLHHAGIQEAETAQEAGTAGEGLQPWQSSLIQEEDVTSYEAWYNSKEL